MERNIYKIGKELFITSDEEIKEGDWVYYLHNSGLHKPSIHKVLKPNYSDYKPYSIHFTSGFGVQEDCKKIILTTDQDLIKDSVQEIDDEFLEWFVKNPSCEEVKFEGHIYKGQYETEYKIIIPKEEPYERTTQSISLSEVDKEESKQDNIEQFQECIKSLDNSFKEQETLEEVAERLYPNYQQEIFIKGAKWQAERMYSEEEVGELLYNIIGQYGKHYGIMIDGKVLNDLFEQFKKK